MLSLSNFFTKLLKSLIEFLKKAKRFTGYMLIYFGTGLINKKGEHQTIIYMIQHLLSSAEIYIRVRDVNSTNKLFVRFTIELASSNYNRINWDYLLYELILQMGCNFSDVAYKYVESRGDNYIYHIDITKTAIENLEKGTAQKEPRMFKEKDAEWYMQKTLMLIEEKPVITTEEVMKKLNISEYHAQALLDQIRMAQIKKMGRQKRLMN